jgi:hypothetical protein
VANEAEQNRKQALSDAEYILMVSLYQQMLDFTRTLIMAADIEEHSELTASLLRQLEVQSSSASKGLSEFLSERLEIFLDDSRWQKLAVRPSEFDVAIRQALEFVRGFLRAKHGIAAHRPTIGTHGLVSYLSEVADSQRFQSACALAPVPLIELMNGRKSGCIDFSNPV